MSRKEDLTYKFRNINVGINAWLCESKFKLMIKLHVTVQLITPFLPKVFGNTFSDNLFLNNPKLFQSQVWTWQTGILVKLYCFPWVPREIRNFKAVWMWDVIAYGSLTSVWKKGISKFGVFYLKSLLPGSCCGKYRHMNIFCGSEWESHRMINHK